MIRNQSTTGMGRATGSKCYGERSSSAHPQVGTLIAFIILFIMYLWSYIVVSRGPFCGGYEVVLTIR